MSKNAVRTVNHSGTHCACSAQSELLSGRAEATGIGETKDFRNI